MKRMSAIAEHIRNTEEEEEGTAGGILAKAEAPMVAIEDINTGTKRKIDELLKVNGHRLQPIEGSANDWMQCAECARVASATS